jgi:DNA-binding NarL/FixJ family response regulator
MSVVIVSIVEDHPLYREALVGVVDDPPALRLAQAVRTVHALHSVSHPDHVVLLDLNLPDLSGADAVRHVVERGYRVLVLSAATDPVTFSAAMTAGAEGYLPKSAEAEQIRWAVRSVARGAGYVSPALAHLVSDLTPARSGTAGGITRREREVLRLLAEGLTDVEIAKRLDIGVRTVRSHLDRIRSKTGRRRRSELTRLALAEGIVGIEETAPPIPVRQQPRAGVPTTRKPRSAP